MTDPTKPKTFSFNFSGRNSREFGLLATSYDFYMPQKRERKQFIPFRHGRHDYGAQYYNERVLRVRCLWTSSRLERMTRSEIREVIHWLSKKGRITLDVEPDKYYIGELYEPDELEAHYNYAKDNITSPLGEFTIEFVCEPFACRDVAGQSLSTGLNEINYLGTAETPCVIVLKNNSGVTLNNVTVTAARRKT